MAAFKKVKGQLGTSAAALLTVSSAQLDVKSVSLHNTDAASISVQLYDVTNSGGSAGTAATADLLWNITIKSNQTILLPLTANGAPHPFIAAGDTLQGKAGTASKVNYVISYYEE
jgi:hypothetical protein